MAREAVEKWGDVNDWRHQIGTGPFMLKDYVSGSSITTIRNPNYYRFDYKYPENRLPYLDRVKLLTIPDLATTLAALRTGKIDLVEDLSWEQAASLKKADPQSIYYCVIGDTFFCHSISPPYAYG